MKALLKKCGFFLIMSVFIAAASFGQTNQFIVLNASDTLFQIPDITRLGIGIKDPHPDARMHIVHDLGLADALRINAGRIGVNIASAGAPSMTISNGQNNGIEVQGAEGSGVYVGRADQSGLSVSEAGINGVLIGAADNFGLSIGTAGFGGVDLGSIGTPSMNINSTDKNAFGVQGVEGNGVWIGQADLNGVHVNSAQGFGIRAKGDTGAAYFEGNVGILTSTPGIPLQVDGGTDAGLGGGGYIMTNSADDKNIVIDDNEIMARNNGNPSQLEIQQQGGDVRIGGNLGIGIIGSPVSELEVDGTATADFFVGDGSGLTNLPAGPWASSGSDVFLNTGRVGIGTSAFGTFISSADDLIIENTTGHAGITISSETASASQVVFADAGTPGTHTGSIQYFHTDDHMEFTVNQTEAMRIDAAGDLEVQGEVNAPATGSANLIPICYGSISETGSILGSTGNFTVDHSAQGVYRISITNETYSILTHLALITPREIVGFSATSNSGDLVLNFTTIINPPIPINSAFVFMVYKP